MATFDLPLPEMTLLRGKLVDYYVDLDATVKADLNLLKAALMKKARLTQDPLTAGKLR